MTTKYIIAPNAAKIITPPATPTPIYNDKLLVFPGGVISPPGVEVDGPPGPGTSMSAGFLCTLKIGV